MILFLLAVVTVSIVLGVLGYALAHVHCVDEGYQAVVQNRKTGKKRLLNRGWHVSGFHEETIEFGWLWRRKVPYCGSNYYIPTEVIHANPALMTVHSKCGMEAKISSEITFRVVDLLKLDNNLFSKVASSVEKVIGEHNYTELYAQKAKIQEEIISELSDDMQQLGVACDEFIIKHF